MWPSCLRPDRTGKGTTTCNVWQAVKHFSAWLPSKHLFVLRIKGHKKNVEIIFWQSTFCNQHSLCTSRPIGSTKVMHRADRLRELYVPCCKLRGNTNLPPWTTESEHRQCTIIESAAILHIHTYTYPNAAGSRNCVIAVCHAPSTLRLFSGISRHTSVIIYGFRSLLCRPCVLL